MPLSMENVSFGKPEMFQDLIKTGSPRISRNWKSWLQITFKSVQRFIHIASCWTRNGVVNGPKYATTPEAITTSPVVLSYLHKTRVIIIYMIGDEKYRGTSLPEFSRYQPNECILRPTLRLNPRRVSIWSRNPPLYQTSLGRLFFVVPTVLPTLPASPIRRTWLYYACIV